MFNDHLPIYTQIMDIIKQRIVSGALREGEKLPSVRDLSTELKVNPNTIQRSYQELEREGFVFTQRGMGTFVTEDKEYIAKLKDYMATTLVKNFMIEMKALGFEVKQVIELINQQIKEEQ